MSALSFAMPIASIALDFFIPKQPDPMLSEIITKIDSLSNKVDDYHKETMQGFKDLEAKFCESTLSKSRATLEDFNDYMLTNIGKKLSI